MEINSRLAQIKKAKGQNKLVHNPSGVEFVHPRTDYSKDRAKWEAHLYKIPDIYQEPDEEELKQYLEMMQHSRGGNSGYNPNLPSTNTGFFAPGQYDAPGTTMYSTANDADSVF